MPWEMFFAEFHAQLLCPVHGQAVVGHILRVERNDVVTAFYIFQFLIFAVPCKHEKLTHAAAPVNRTKGTVKQLGTSGVPKPCRLKPTSSYVIEHFHIQFSGIFFLTGIIIHDSTCLVEIDKACFAPSIYAVYKISPTAHRCYGGD